jgi:hypothetical protein
MERTYKPGDYLVKCDRTGFTYYRSQCRTEWNGLLVRKESWEARHPQDLIRSIRDDQSVPDPNPPGEDIFLEPGDVSADDL